MRSSAFACLALALVAATATANANAVDKPNLWASLQRGIDSWRAMELDVNFTVVVGLEGEKPNSAPLFEYTPDAFSMQEVRISSLPTETHDSNRRMRNAQCKMLLHTHCSIAQMHKRKCKMHTQMLKTSNAQSTISKPQPSYM